ncbi:MAG TPA: TOBE domain-containing protein, partial [Propylenella sp.]|nr:TOBE domain-containing protein [Propylenella sp.]
ASRPVEFAIRPEDVEPGAAGLRGTVKVVEPLGPHQLVSLQVDGRLFRAVLDNHHRIRAGEELVLAPKTDRVRWFDAETGVAIQ